MKGTFIYQCQECEELLTSVPKGICTHCGSQTTLPLGWYRLSPDERRSWLDRIQGRSRGEPIEKTAQIAE